MAVVRDGDQKYQHRPAGCGLLLLARGMNRRATVTKIPSVMRVAGEKERNRMPWPAFRAMPPALGFHPRAASPG
jgi:hypothetical protein